MGSESVSEGGRSDRKRDWSDQLAHGGTAEPSIPDLEAESDHWSYWHYGIYFSSALILFGAFEGSLLSLAVGYVLMPAVMYLDAGYVESVTPGWKRDAGLYVLGSLLFPMLMVPMYLYRRRELRGLL